MTEIIEPGQLYVMGLSREKTTNIYYWTLHFRNLFSLNQHNFLFDYFTKRK